jgi:hypothetical protein
MQELVQEAIFNNVHQQRCFLAEAAPICSRRLHGLFGYNAVTITAQAILKGTYKYPPDFDQATREICKECARIRLMIPKNYISTVISKEDWKGQWRGLQESTSPSGLGSTLAIILPNASWTTCHIFMH